MESNTNANNGAENQAVDKEDIVFPDFPHYKVAVEHYINERGQQSVKFVQVRGVTPDPHVSMIVDGVDTPIEQIDQVKKWVEGKWTFEEHLRYFNKLEQVRPLTDVEEKNRTFIHSKIVQAKIKLMKAQQEL